MKISVVTVSYNDSKRLERTIRSVEAQDSREFEYIVVDGNSSDGSRSVIESHRGIIGKAIIESDTGPFQAMNRGAAVSSGEYLLFLNAGDELRSSTSLSEAMVRLAGKDIYYTDAVFSSRGSEWIQKYPDHVNLDYLLIHALNHQNMLLRRNFLAEQGGYDESFGIISDWAFMVKAFWKSRPSIERLPIVISRYFLDGISGAKRNRAKVLGEKEIFLKSIDPELGPTLYKYVRQCDGEYYRVESRFRDKRVFERAMIVPLAIMKMLLRIGVGK